MAREDLRTAAAEQISRWERLLSDELLRLWDRQEAVVLARLQGTKARKNTRHWHPPGEQKVDPTYVLDPTRWTLDAAGSVEPTVRRIYAETYASVATQLVDEPPPPPEQAPAEPGAPAEPPVPPTEPPVPPDGGATGALLAAALVAALVLGDGGDDDGHPLLGAFAWALLTLRARRQAALEAGVQRQLALVAAMARGIGDQVQAAISAGELEAMAMPDIVKSVRAIYAEQKKDWTDKIAAAVVPSAVNEASHIAVGDVAEALTVTAQTAAPPPSIFKQWLSSRDDRVRPTHRHADGQVVPLAERFTLGGIVEQPVVSYAMFPGDPELPPGERINCRCTMLFSKPAFKPEAKAFDATELVEYSIDAMDLKGFDPEQARDRIGRWTKIPGLGALKPDHQGRDTSVAVFGMQYHPSYAEREDVKAAKAWKGWGQVPVRTWDIGGSATPIATEKRLDSKPIKKVLAGDPLRKGYDPQILRTDDGDFLIDGHHRVAMHLGLGHETMPARVLDARSVRGGFDGAVERLREEAAAADLKAAADIADRMVSRAEKSDPIITPIIEETVESLGGAMDGLQHRIKTRESTARKIMTRSHMKRTSPEAAAGGVSDVLRYTAVLPTEGYTDGVKKTLEALRKAGFSPSISNNYWARGDAYSGLNILLSGKGQGLEVQFHTPESLAAKELAHDDYEICRDESKPLEERMAAWHRMIPLWDAVPQPEGWWDLGSLFIYDPPGKGRGHYISKWEAQGLPEPPKKPVFNPIDPASIGKYHHGFKPSLKPPWTFGGKFPWSKREGH